MQSLFFELVSRMRDKQKEYFKTRSKDTLIESKQLEKQVDDEIARVSLVIQYKKNGI